MTAPDICVFHTNYASERAKRLRPDGNDQYIQLSGRFAGLLEDPFNYRIEREPRRDHVQFAFVGGGFSGLTTGARLREAGVADIRIVESGGDFGGTWYWNRYPGVRCDIASVIYLPLLEETGYIPTEWYPKGSEILEHCQRIAKQYDLYESALFHTRVTELEWDEIARLWIVRTDRGDEFTAQFVGLGTGHQSVPKLPGIPGIETFAGHAFHASRWDYAYTGDPAGGPLGKLRDKRVAIIGTGATSVQCVPHLAAACQELLVFQRTPSAVDVRGNRPIDPEWFARVATSGWQGRWMDNFAANMTASEQPAEDLVNDGWTDLVRRARQGVAPSSDSGTPGQVSAKEYADFEKMCEIHARVDATVQNPQTAERLKPWYSLRCKRVCFHDEYLDAFNMPTVHLIHTDGKGVERITPRGVVAAGTKYEVDCIVYSSGFEASTAPSRRAGFDPIGRGGVRLSEYWADGLRTMHGVHVRGFPNAFLIQPFGGGPTFPNFAHTLSESAEIVAATVAHTLSEGFDIVEVTQQAQDAWAKQVGIDPEWRKFLANCTPGYLNQEGTDLGPYSIFYQSLNSDAVEFFQYMRQWRASGGFEGLEFSRR